MLEQKGIKLPLISVELFEYRDHPIHSNYICAPYPHGVQRHAGDGLQSGSTKSREMLGLTLVVQRSLTRSLA